MIMESQVMPSLNLQKCLPNERLAQLVHYWNL